MKQISQIIKSRITDILELKLTIDQYVKGEISETDRHQFICEQKKSEKYRCIKESQALYALNQTTLAYINVAQQLYQITVDIMMSYDPQYIKYLDKFSKSIPENLRKVYVDFFNTHGFTQKSKHINQIFQKGLVNLSPAILLGWLSQWSKRVYYEVLQKQIRQSFKKRSQLKSNLQQIKKKITNKQQFMNCTNIMNDRQNNQIQTLCMISISSRSALYSFMQNDLQEYYQFHDILDLDNNYVKNLRKRNKKQELLKSNVLKKAQQVMIETTNNKVISTLMKNYASRYYEKYPKKMYNSYNTKCLSPKKIILSPLKNKETKTENPQLNMNMNKIQSKLLSPKHSQIQFIRPEQIEIKIKKLNFLNSHTSKNNLQFPQIGKNSNTSNTFIRKKLSFNFFDKKQFAHNNKNLLANQNKHFSFSTMERKTNLDSSFLICEGLNHDQNHKHHQLIKIQKKTKSSKRKNISTSDPDYLYNDQKLKPGKSFQINKLTKNKKSLFIKNKITNNLKDLYQ